MSLCRACVKIKKTYLKVVDRNFFFFSKSLYLLETKVLVRKMSGLGVREVTPLKIMQKILLPSTVESYVSRNDERYLCLCALQTHTYTLDIACASKSLFTNSIYEIIKTVHIGRQFT
jgi:hypothetical protein